VRTGWEGYFQGYESQAVGSWRAREFKERLPNRNSRERTQGSQKIGTGAKELRKN
jgi:hypothetical protein